MTSDLALGIAPSPQWVRLPVAGHDDARTWARSTMDELAERSARAGFDIDRRVLRKDLRARLEDSRRRDPVDAFLLYPEGFDTALATLELDLIHPDSMVPVITLDWLAKTFSADDFGPPQISFTDLPIGRAVRIRQNFAAADPPPGGSGILLETLTYGVLPTGTPCALMLLVSWTFPGISAQMEETAHAIAQTLTVEHGGGASRAATTGIHGRAEKSARNT
ncbi:hypothetical protein [Streptomyces sp. enrichment culture]|uniref:hypothetical protein n=1 Tax=Streptomyces sp. enrichment culture TaxID=1795815 RepID=UPI003F54D63B